MSDSIFSDDFKAQPFWWDATPPPGIVDQAVPRNTEVLIIGSGYTGLNCGIETARGGLNTLVIDTESVGWGCSSRNGGQISGEIKPGYSELKRRYGAEKAFDLVKEARNALDWVGNLFGQRKSIANLFNVGASRLRIIQVNSGDWLITPITSRKDSNNH